MVTTLVKIAYPIAVIVVILFGLLAIILAIRRQRKHGPDTPEFFLTARGTVGTMTIAWSFYAAGMGSWALFSVPSFAVYGGIVGVITYAIAVGLPILVIAFFGGYIQRLIPTVVSLSDFSARRFGRIVQLYVTVLMCFNMGVALTAEYTTLGDLFEVVIGWKRLPIVIITGVVASIYTSWGGLYASVITDQWQAGVSVAVISIMVVFVGVTFKRDLPSFKTIKANTFIDLGANNYSGLSSICYFPVGLVTSTIFSEAMWQRCWASANDRALYTGATIAAMLLTTATFLLGFGGVLAIWGGLYQNLETDNPNTILFTLFKPTWILVIISVLSATMSESAIDSLQSAIVDCIAGAVITPYFPKLNVMWIRVLVLVLNVPPIIVSLRGYSVIELFLFANLVTTTSAIPLLLGLWWRSALSQKIITPFSMMSGCTVGLSSIFWWSKVRQLDGQSYGKALHYMFFTAYDWPPFMLALGFSIVGIALGAFLEFVFRAITRTQYRRVELDEAPDSTRQLPPILKGTSPVYV